MVECPADPGCPAAARAAKETLSRTMQTTLRGGDEIVLHNFEWTYRSNPARGMHVPFIASLRKQPSKRRGARDPHDIRKVGLALSGRQS